MTSDNEARPQVVKNGARLHTRTIKVMLRYKSKELSMMKEVRENELGGYQHGTYAGQRGWRFILRK
jgi:hypothetical protein